MTRFIALLICCVIGSASAAAGDQKYKADPLAVKFGSVADVRGMRLSPDGMKVSVLKWVPQDVPALVIFDLAKKQGRLVAGSKKGEAEIRWCDWANNDRLLCGYRLIANIFGAGGYLSMTRLVGVNTDGSKLKTLIDPRQEDAGQFKQYRDRIVDWLVDDPEDVLVQVPTGYGSGVGKLDIFSGHITSDISQHDRTYDWIADGRGNTRLYEAIEDNKSKWYVRRTEDAPWTLLHESKMDDLDDHFTPAGFGANENALLYFDTYEGHIALWAEDLSKNEKPHVVFSNPDVDVSGLLTLGKHQRLAAVRYYSDRPRWHFVDDRIAKVHDEVMALFPNQNVDVIDESWDRKYYLVIVSGASNPGTLYRFVRESNTLQALARIYPKLADTTMAPVKPITFKARDGVDIPGYLTRPASAVKGPLPTVVLPHGGPQSRDVWSFDSIVQFLAANGYAVLQVNFRGSGGYGQDWAGVGGFQNWRQAINDITDGAKSLIENGTSDPKRICIVGWSYGGYAALMSVIEEQTLYKCAVSIAGVTDIKDLVGKYSRFIGYSQVNAFAGDNAQTLAQGSPQSRADEIKVPVLMFQGDHDLNVPEEQGKAMAVQLENAHVPHQYIVYKDVEHDIMRNQYRIDMLSRIGEFLKKNIGS